MMKILLIVFLLTVFIQVKSESSLGAIRVHPLTVCSDSIELSLRLGNIPVSPPLQCSEMLFPLFSKFGAATKIFITGQNTTLWLRNLNMNTTYIFQVNCETGYASDKELLTTTVDECENIPLPTEVVISSDVSSTNTVYMSKSANSVTATATEIVYTVCLSLVGVIVVLIPVYFVWKRHRRRQRIRRIFGHVSTDAFENLHDHMEIDDSPTAV